MVGLQYTHTHMSIVGKYQYCRINVRGKSVLQEKIKVFVYLLGQLEVLHQVLLALSQLKYSLRGERKLEKKRQL